MRSAETQPSGRGLRGETRSAAPAYRMRDLVRASGASRETIHFYLASGLLPAARKTGRNAALYGDEHLRALRKIRELRERHFLPLRAIRAILVESSDAAAFTPPQRRLIETVRAEMAARPLAATPGVSVRDAKRRAGLTAQEIAEFRDLGVIDVVGSGAQAMLGAEDLRLLELWGRAKAIGGFRSRGVSPRHAAVLRDVVEILVQEEMRLFASFYSGVRGEAAASVLEKVLPLLNEILGLLHIRSVGRYFQRDQPRRRRSRARR